MQSLIRNSVEELKKIKEEAKSIAKQQMIAEARETIEANAMRIMEQILQDKAAEEAVPADGGEAPVEPVLTTIPNGDEFSIDAAPLGGAEDAATPTVTTTTDDEGNVDIVIDTDPATPGIQPAGETAPNPVAEVPTEFSANAIPGAPATNPAPAAGPEGGAMAGIPNTETPEEIDMTNASADDILEKFSTGNQEGTLKEVEVVADPAAQGGAEGASSEDAELDAFLAEAFGMEDETEESDECAQPLSEEQLAEIEARLDEDMLDDMNGGASSAPAPAEPTSTGDVELDEAQTRNLANGRNQTQKPEGFPEERMGGRMNEAKETIALFKKQVAAIILENKQLKEQATSLTSLNEGMEKNLGLYKSKFHEAMMLSYKTGHVNKILMEQITTQDQKKTIMESFSKAETKAEVTTLYEKFSKDFKNTGKNSLNEGKSVAERLSPVFTSEGGTDSKSTLNEGRASLNPGAERMMKIINYKRD